ncbi:MAG: hypothetical protein ACXADD_18580 [Candidatus Thorarchaeota archaeon]
MSEPSRWWDKVLEVSALAQRVGLVPVVFSRLWVRPSKALMREMVDYGVLLHGTVTALDQPEHLRLREQVCRNYLRSRGDFVARLVSFHFDDTIEAGLRLWDLQDNLVSGQWGASGDRKPLRLENPARVMRGTKEENPNWSVLADWAYFKAPTTKDHKFSAYNHNWTAGVLYDNDVCWVACRYCSVKCHTQDKQTILSEF